MNSYCKVKFTLNVNRGHQFSIIQILHSIKDALTPLQYFRHVLEESYYEWTNTFSFPRKEFELLILLASKPGKVFTRSEISKHIWNRDIKSGARSIDVFVRHIRKKLGEDIIYTVVGVGYKLVV